MQIQGYILRTFGAMLILSLAASAQGSHPIFAIRSPAPNFELPGIDGAMIPSDWRTILELQQPG